MKIEHLLTALLPMAEAQARKTSNSFHKTTKKRTKPPSHYHTDQKIKRKKRNAQKKARKRNRK